MFFSFLKWIFLPNLNRTSILTCHIFKKKCLNFKLISISINQQVEFYAPWCPHCRRFKPIYAKVSKTLTEEGLGEKVHLVAIDCTTDEGKDVCRKHGVRSYPTIKHLGCDTSLEDFLDLKKREAVKADRKHKDYMEFIRGLDTCPAGNQQVAADDATETKDGFSVQNETEHVAEPESETESVPVVDTPATDSTAQVFADEQTVNQNAKEPVVYEEVEPIKRPELPESSRVGYGGSAGLKN